MWLVVLVAIIFLFGLWEHYFGPKKRAKPSNRLRPRKGKNLATTQSPEHEEYSRSYPSVQTSADNQSQHQEVVFRCQPGVIYDEFTNFRGENGGSHYPPDWDARRDRVKQRDSFRCQVTGCPNLMDLDVHHIDTIANGGSHALPNLVCLCIVHHWMLPDHDLVRERVPESSVGRFTMRRAHRRWVNGKWIKVKATFERHVKCSVSDCETIRDAYGLRCPMCDSEGIHFAIFDDDLVVACLGCRSAWKMRRLLAEEVGTLLGSILKRGSNAAHFVFDLDNLPDRQIEQIVLCDKCADFARIGIFVPRDGQYGRFHGCINFHTHQCRNSRERQLA
jgi:hypothetical protein